MKMKVSMHAMSIDEDNDDDVIIYERYFMLHRVNK